MMLRPIAENPFADRQIEELQFAERIESWSIFRQRIVYRRFTLVPYQHGSL
jgi:hypothetical protein